ncbi:MAG: aminopeptidase [Sphingomonadales bacterium]
MIVRTVRVLAGAGMVSVFLASGVALAKPDCSEDGGTRNTIACSSSWLDLTARQERAVSDFASDYKRFMGRAKTELATVTEAVKLARAAGFVELKPNSPLTPGAKYYDINRDRAMALIVIGARPMVEGFRVVVSHIDSPHLDLKGQPLYEADRFALFQTNFHGGIKNYQWTSMPLALMGRVDLKDGRTVDISVGNEPDDPTFVIPELSPHVSRGLRDRTAANAIKKEELDPLAGHIPEKASNSVKTAVQVYLEQNYGIGLNDLVSAELALVPAYPPRDVGFDRGLMAIYGQDDRLSAYASLRAIASIDKPDRTLVAYLADNEEVGNVNNTGASSSYLVDLLERMIYMKRGAGFRSPMLKQALRASKVLSADVNPGVNPLWPSAWELGNAPRLGYGVNLKIYGRGFNANSEFTAWMRKTLDDAKVPWQTSTYKVGRAGGGTVGREFSRHNMDVIDIGVPVLSIHTPYSISSKVDVYWLYQAMSAFYAR